MGTNYLGAALAEQTVEVRRLSSADLLAGVKNIPLRILETHFEEEEGNPDSLWIALSSGRYFSMRHDGGTYAVFERSTRIPETDEVAVTGLSRAVLNELHRKLVVHHAECMAEVQS